MCDAMMLWYATATYKAEKAALSSLMQIQMEASSLPKHQMSAWRGQKSDCGCSDLPPFTIWYSADEMLLEPRRPGCSCDAADIGASASGWPRLPLCLSSIKV